MRVIILFIALLSLQTSFANDNNALRDSIVDYSQTFIGTTYIWGGSSPEGFDCSGFVHYVFKKFGIQVSRASSGYENEGTEVPIETCVPADLILFTGTDHTRRKVGHLGIVINNDNGIVDFIHSSSSKKHFGVCITRYNESGYTKRFLRVISVL